LFIPLFVFLAGGNLRAQEGGADISAPERTASERTAIDESTLVLGEEAAPSEAPEGAALSVFGVWDFLRMVLVLAIVVGLIYGIFHFIKKAASPRDGGVRFIRVLETRPLTGNRHLHLVEVGNAVLLVGSAETGVRLVSEISDRQTLDDIRLAASRTGPAPGNFVDALKGVFGGSRRSVPVPGEQSASGAERADSLEFMKKQKDRLKKF
jgi:flagellar protein FliO/FliZ